MKKSDIAMIILIASISVAASFFIVRSIPFFTVSDEEVVIPHIEAISPEVADVDPLVFNEEAINPTVQAVIGSGDAGTE